MRTAKEIIRRQEEMRTDRSGHEDIWTRIADVLRPLRNEINNDKTPGDRRHKGIYDSSPIYALEQFKAGLVGMMTNPANKWFTIRVSGDDELNEFAAVKEWREQVTKIMLLSFGTGVSNFYEQVPALYGDLGAFGTGFFFTAEVVGRQRIFDSCRAISECYAAANEWDEIDTVYRKFKLSARQAVQMFKGKVPERIKTAADRGNEQDRFWFIHATEPNEDLRTGKPGPDGKPWHSIYVNMDEGEEVGERGGFDDFPWQVPRWDVAAGETYGRSQGEVALADIKTINQMRRSNLTAAHRMADPSLLAPDEGKINGGVRAYPGRVIYGGMGADGRPLVAPLNNGSNIPVALEFEEQVRNAIKDAFYFSLMQMVGDKTMTATEVIERQEEKLRLMAPHLGRIESEFLSPQIKRRFNILARAGQIPPAPEELSGADLDIDFVSPLARMQKTTEAQSAMRITDAATLMAQIMPEVVDRLDADELIEKIAEGFGTPGALRSREEAGERRAQRQQQEQMAQAAALAEQGGKAFNQIAQGGKAMKEQAASDGQAA